MHDEAQVEPSCTAILVDMQNDFVKEGGSLLVPGAEGPSQRYELSCRSPMSPAKVAFTQGTPDDGDPDREIWPEHVREGSWGWAIVEELRGPWRANS